MMEEDRDRASRRTPRTAKESKPDDRGKADRLHKPEQDAAGQFAAARRAGRKNDGTASADPEVLSHKDSGDATFTSDPKKKSTRRQ